MARVAGIEIPLEKKIEVSLRYIYGIGPSSARRVVALAKIDPEKRTKNLSDEELTKIREVIDKNYTVEGPLRREVGLNVKRQKDNLSYRGLRHIRNLPAHGQRTRTNARTKKGRRPLIGGMKKKESLANEKS